MPMDRTAYPANWEAFSLEIRVARARHQCECTGECGMHRPGQIEPNTIPCNSLPARRCREINHQAARFGNGRIILSVAHLCDCYPLCANPDHVKAMCQRCHLRTDRYRHATARLRTQSSPSYKSQRYRAAGKAHGIENLDEIVNLPKRKRRTFWTNPINPTN